MPAETLRLAIMAVAPVLLALLLGQIATYPNLVPWYEALAKPAFNPPNWVFAPAWTCLYALMAFAAWRILRLPKATPGRSGALAIFMIQLVLNAAWSWLFFGLHSPLAGLLDIVPQFLVIALCIDRFRRLDKLAAWALAPLLAWVGFAAVLNFSIWSLNG